MDWAKEFELKERDVSVIDIQTVPTPLAMNAISGRLLYCGDHSARYITEGIIMSKAESVVGITRNIPKATFITDSYYISSVRSNVINYQSELEELSKILQERNLSTFEYRACERNLQVSIETAIGVAKHWS